MTLSINSRVFLFVESGGPGGAERVVLNLASELTRQKVPVMVATLRAGWFTDQLKAAGIRHQQISTWRGLDPLLPVRIAVAARRFGASVIHSHLLDSNFYCSIAARMLGIRHVATEHGDVHHSNKRRFVALKLQIVSRLGSKLVAVSRFTADACAITAGIPVPAVVPNPIPGPINVPHSARTLLRTQYGVSESDFLWINVANLRPVKDQATLLRAFALTVKNLPNQKLIILGEGGERTKLESLTRELGLGNSVHLRGAVDDVANFLAAADGCVLSSRSEALPMSLLEAMSYGVPIVATSVGGIPEIISHGVTGLLSPPGESEKLAKYMLEVASDVARAGGLGASAKQYSSKFLAPEVVAIYSGFYS